MLSFLSAVIKFDQVYCCAACSKKEIGCTVRTSFAGTSASDLKDFVDRVSSKLSSVHMPIGWSYGTDNKFNCGCKKQEVP